ncbi:MAG TPA: TolC family protein [Gemmatimonadaceae bacterium]|jgi:outer membrane protein TolC
MSTSIKPIARRGAARGYLWMVSALAFAPLSLVAQDPAVPTPAAVSRPGSVLLGDLYTQIQRANPRAAASRSLAQAAVARVPGATRPPDPQVQLGFMNYTLPSLAPMATLGMRQVQVMQMLPLGGKLALAGQVAGAQASAAGERAEEVTWELRSEAAMSFYDLYATDRRLDVMRETVRLLQDIEKTAASMYRVGEGRQTDVLRAQVEIARMVEDTLRMLAMRETMVAKLNALLDRPADTPIGNPALPQFPDSMPPRARLDSLAYGNRPMIRAGLEEVRAAEASEKLARKEIWPDLQVGAQYAQRGGDMGGTERMGSLMVGATVPIFARSRQYRMREETFAMKRMAEADVAQMRAETRGKIGEAYANLVRARNLAQLYRSTVLPQAGAAVASALSAYRVGSVDFMTLLDNQMTVNKYRQELFALDADQGKAWAELEMLTSRVLLDSNKVSAATRGDK